ncbi:cytoplasmic protein [Rhizoctonia solani 123E]|uniref:Cytoplasmic protein n=1 Tax=Rhizoctonia solani 123E TaxID=1423351 RepID=A0A074RST2_9AGAM|nr:cytoplasmic protein [Rhizoctonia solani 123E]
MSLIGSVVERTPNATGSATSMTPFPVSSDPKTGFPTVAHRSQRQRKSAFRQNMEAARPISRDAVIPVIQPFSEVASPRPAAASETSWRSTMEAENARKVALMTSEQREEELRQLSSKFGDIAGLASVLRRAKDSKPKTGNKGTTSPTVEEVSDEDNRTAPPLEVSSLPPVRNPQHRVATPPRPVLSRRSSVSGISRPGASTPGVRFAEVTSRDVFTYPSAPTSPKRTTLMIEAPPAEGSGEDIPKLQWKGKIPPAAKAVPLDHQSGSPSGAIPGNEIKKQESAHPLSQVVALSPSSTPSEIKPTNLSTDISSQIQKSEADTSTNGTAPPALKPIDTLATPEAIRQQYFPNEPQTNPNLEWMADLPEIPDTPITSEYAYIGGMNEKARFNLAGTPIPHDIGKEMPSHDGLHHNSRSTAGYTLGELLHLARSTAPMQRAMALDALARLTARVGRRELGAWFPRAQDSSNRDQTNSIHDENKRVVAAAELRKLVIDSATSALNERGAVGTRAIDCLYAALVVWDHEIALVDDVELGLRLVGSDRSNLHVMPSNYVTSATTALHESGLDEMNVVDKLVLDPILETAIRQFSARSLPRSVLGRLLEIIVRLSRQSKAHASSIIATKGLIAEIMRLFILSGSPYPDPSDSEQPDALAIRLLAILARSSRQNASSLLDPTDTLLRFVAVLPPDDVPPTLLIATLDLYSILGQYGMYAHIATTAADSFNALSEYVRKRRDAKLTKAWMRLRMVWTACAIDPHSTTPPHEILWSQVDGWSWGEDTIAWAQDSDVESGILAEIWNALVVWLEGAAVNSVRGGSAEREQVIEALREGFQSGHPRSVLESAISRLDGSLSGDTAINLLQEQSVADAALIYAALRLDLALLTSPSQSNDVTPQSPLGLPLETLHQLANKIAVSSIWSAVYSGNTTSPYDYTRTTHLALCLTAFLLFVKRIGHIQGRPWLKLAFIALYRLNPACADIAARLVQEIGATIIKEPSLIHFSDHLKPANWSALLPFILHDLQPSPELIVGPRVPSNASISHVTTLSLPSRPNLGGKLYGLPVHSDWTMNPLNHLLHSGTSAVFKSLPNEWDSDEVDVVRATLALTCVRQKVLSDESTLRMTSSEVLFGCMRVFMLEHGQPHDDSSSEIFRDSQVEQMVSFLLSKVALRPDQLGTKVMAAPLEIVANTHLSGQPFYQFYTDLVGLYDAISFAHPLFSRVLLPPLSMNYAKDYRRLLWGDYGHILRSIQTKLPEVPGDTLEEWLWPRDKDAEMIGWYVKALMKGGVQGFLRFIAVHHVATSIWPEFGSEDANSWDMSSTDKERARMIIGAMAHQAGPALFAALMLYEQKKLDIIPYPVCYEGRGLDGERRRRRVEWAVSLCGERVRSRLDYVYNT